MPSSATRRVLIALALGSLAILASADVRTAAATQHQKDEAAPVSSSFSQDILAAAGEAFGSIGTPKEAAATKDDVKTTANTNDKRAIGAAIVDAGLLVDLSLIHI